MIVYYDRQREYADGRLHPYGADAHGQRAFVDFMAHPEKISTSLEDFLPFSDQTAIQTFYQMLAHLNGAGSHLETVDCAFRGPGKHNDPNSNLALSTDGRLFLMYRDVRINCSKEHYKWLCGKLMHELKLTDPDFPATEGVVGFSLNKALHVEISDGIWLPSGEFEASEDDRGIGYHTMLTFWAYGNSESELFANLDRVFRNIWEACKLINKSIDDAGSGVET
jgi:hypothetical protein